MENDGYLDELAWQIMVFVLLGLAAVLAVWLTKQYRRWLARRFTPLPKWAGPSAWGVGVVLFVVLAVVFGFFMDQTGGV
jgi:uncharacterized protein involved in cysteine biosynthesis